MARRRHKSYHRRFLTLILSGALILFLSHQHAWAGFLPRLAFFFQLNLTLLAGNIGGSGNIDGVGLAARFSGPIGTAVDTAGNVYVADTNNHMIRKISPNGVVTTVAGSGQPGLANGIGATASFSWPSDVGVDGSGNLYVADQMNHLIRKISPAGLVTTFAGIEGVSGYQDGQGAAALFDVPKGITVDSAGVVYVAEDGGRIRKISTAGVVSTLFTGTSPLSGIAVDADKNVYVSDGSCVIRKITAAGLSSVFAGSASSCESTDGTGSNAHFLFPTGVGIDSFGNIFVSEMSSTIRKITPAGVVTTVAGKSNMSGSNDGTGASARFMAPQSVDVDSLGNVFIADNLNNNVRKMTNGGVVTTLAGAAANNLSIDGVGANAGFTRPTGTAVDSSGTVYVSDILAHTIRKITSDGTVTTLAGLNGTDGSADGTGSNARFNGPRSLTVDSARNIFVADTWNNTIRKITPAGVVSTVAGTAGIYGSADGTGSAAEFNAPCGITIDLNGNFYVADTQNNTIRKITPAGIVTTLAGSPYAEGWTNGTGNSARFTTPMAIVADSTGNLFVADWGNHLVRKITPAGEVTTLAGSPGNFGSIDGTGSAARFNNPASITIDTNGNLYVGETANHSIRKITPGGVVTTLYGKEGRAGTFLGPSNSVKTSLGDGLEGIAFVPSRLIFTVDQGVVTIPLR